MGREEGRRTTTARIILTCTDHEVARQYALRIVERTGNRLTL